MTHEELWRLADDLIAFELRMKNLEKNKLLSPSLRVGAIRAQAGLKEIVQVVHDEINRNTPRLEV